MSNTPPAAPKAKPADLPDTDLEEDADSENRIQQGLKTFGDDSASTNPAALSDLGASEEELSTISDDINGEEAHERYLALFKESIVDRPLVDVLIPISDLRDEYKNPAFIEQINWLEEHGYHSIRRTRGDGDCFYRSFGFAFVERLFHVTDTHEAFRRVTEVLDGTLRMFQALSFDGISYEDSYDTLRELIQYVLHGQDGEITREESLMTTFRNLYAQIQLAPDDYAPFLTNQDIPNSEEILEPQDFSARFVIPLGKEAGWSILMNVDIAYVDGREDHNQNTAQKVRLVPFRSDIDKDATPISLLYRPGHYDILVGKYHD
ncbi:hypothetical protein C0992_006701 [Termitomyces sp. T32_za158]|nr:hypothetical protein C0992_006701 [Termitomyces sp. T32_za158]